MRPINVQELKVQDPLMYYSDEAQKWVLCVVVSIGLNYITVGGTEGALNGFTWNEDLSIIQDTNHFRQYIPEPPKPPKKKSWWNRFGKWLLEKAFSIDYV